MSNWPADVAAEHVAENFSQSVHCELSDRQ